MDKYYRVRTQEQWNWLMEYFEKRNKHTVWDNDLKPTNFDSWEIYEDKTVVHLNGENKLSYADYQFYVDRDKVTAGFIEVSDLMEDEKMENYITIKGEDLLSIMDEKGKRVLCGANKLNEDWEGYFLRGMGYIQEFNIPADKIYPKIKFTEAEKARFDKLKYICDECFGAMLMISKNDNKPLFSKLFVLEGYRKAQTDFALAWAHPELIEIVPEKKWIVKVPATDNCYFYKYKNRILAGVPHVHFERFQFTQAEIDQHNLQNYKREEVKQ